MNNLFLIALILVFNSVWSQDYPHSGKISDCDGAVDLKKGDISLNLPNSLGIFDDLANYKVNFEHANSIWLRFIAPKNGSVELEFDEFSYMADVFLFKTDKENICDEIGKGTLKPSDHYIGFSDNQKLKIENKDFLYLKEGEVLFLSLNFKESKIKEPLKGKVSFSIDEEEVNEENHKIVDLRIKEKDYPTLEIEIIDEETLKPVKSSIVVQGTKRYDAYYTGSDIKFSLDRSLRFELKLDAVGYFPKDTSFRIMDLENMNIKLLMMPVEVGTQITLEGIEFLPESTQLTGDAVGRLKRVRDFLALNSNVKIEVQGHVHKFGRNTIGSRILSRRRARSVSRELIKSGIDKSRVSFKGFGNSKMKYPEAQTSEEETANRRVEIKITGKWYSTVLNTV